MSRHSRYAWLVRFFSTDPDVPGVIAVGQFATGIFALGQVAVGVVAIGQIARGVFAVGQVAVGVFAVGQAALGVVYGGGMIAAAGRGFGICLKVLPKMTLFRYLRPKLPTLVSYEEIARGAREAGWVLARIVGDRLRIDGAFPDLELAEGAEDTLERAIAQQHNHACLRIETRSDVVGASDAGYRRAVKRERVLTVPRLRTWEERSPRVEVSGPLTDAVGLSVRAAGFVLLIVAWAGIAGRELLEIVLAL